MKAQKGSAFERSLCRTLSEWFSGGTASDWYWRTPASGARATVRGKKSQTSKGHYGDIAATCPEGEPLTRLLTLEVKRGYPRVTISDLLDKPDGAAQQTLEKWFEQAHAAHVLAGSFSWAVVHKRDRREAVMYYPSEVFNTVCELAIQHSCQYTRFYVIPAGVCIWALPLRDFLAHVLPESVRELVKRLK